MRAFFHVAAILAVFTTSQAFAQEGDDAYAGILGASEGGASASSSAGAGSFYVGGDVAAGNSGGGYDPYGAPSAADAGASIYGDVAKAGSIYGDGKQATDLYGYVEESDAGMTPAARRAIAARKAQEAREEQTVELKSQKDETKQRYREEAQLRAQEHAAKMQALNDAAQ